MLTNREREELERKKAILFVQGLGVESKWNPEITLNDNMLIREEGANTKRQEG
jgi:hypothetical protein